MKKLGGDDDGEGRKEKGVIFKGVNKNGDILETLKLMRDLKMSKTSSRMSINT